MGSAAEPAQAEETGPGSGVCVEEFGPRWGREKLLGLWDPLAVGPSHPPIAALRALRKGLSLDVLLRTNCLPQSAQQGQRCHGRCFVTAAGLCGLPPFPAVGREREEDVATHAGPRRQEAGGKMTISVAQFTGSP